MIVRAYSIIAASTGRTEQVLQARGQLHGLVYSIGANATIAIYNSSTSSNQIASILATSGVQPAPGDLDFKGYTFDKLTVITTGAITGLTILYS